jgi:hypothetical protein
MVATRHTAIVILSFFIIFLSGKLARQILSNGQVTP